MTHNKNRIYLLYFLINFIAARSTPEVLFLKEENIIRFSNTE